MTGNMTLYALWQPITYTIQFVANGGTGTAVPNQAVTFDTKPQLSKNTLSRYGYNFDGWTTNSDGTGKKYADQATLTDNLTSEDGATVRLYAQWKPKLYTVTFDVNKGTGSTIPTGRADPITVEYGKPYGSLPVLTRVGYQFLGWAKSTDGTWPVTRDDIVSGDHTLYARWTAKTITVKFEGNGATSGSMSQKTYTYDMVAYLPANTYVREGYIFAGWNRNPSYQFAQYSDMDPVSSIWDHSTDTVTLYAYWTKYFIVPSQELLISPAAK